MFSRPIQIALAFSILVPTSARSAASHLSWSDCGTHGADDYVTFACNTNVGQHVLVPSFIPPPGIDQFLGAESNIEIYSQNSSLPDWWKIRNTGQCRNGSLLVDIQFASNGLTHCADPFGASGFGGIGAYNIGYGAANRARLLVGFARPDPIPVSPDVEYYAARIVINHSRSTGADACGGCDVPVLLYLRLTLRQSAGAPGGDVAFWDYGFHSGPYDVGAHSVGWQCPATALLNCHDSCDFLTYQFQCSTPAVRSSWGQIKSLYR